MIKRIILPVTILLIAIAVFIAMKQSKPEKAVLSKPEKVWLVNTVPVSFQHRSPEITLYGRVETPRQATLSSALAADVLSVNVLEGTEVNMGDVLIKLDDTDTQLLFTQRQADLAEIAALINSENERFQRDKGLLEHESQLLQLTENAVVRAQKLEQSRLASQATLDEALANKQRQLLTLKRLKHDVAEHPARLAQLQARQKRAQALLEQATVDMQRCTITAPFTGRIAKLNIAVGDRVRVGDALLSVYDLENLEVRAQLPGRVINQVRQMMNEEQPLIAHSMVDNQALQFSLTRLSGEVRVDSGGIDGLFKLSGNGHPLALGTFVELNLKLAPQDKVLELPFNALYGLDRVYLLKDGYLQAVNIQRIGEYTNDNGEKRLLVTAKELREGDLVVSTQLPNATTGLRVETFSD